MKKILALSFVASLAIPLSASAGIVNWTNWSDASSGTTSQNGNNISVTYTGETLGVDYGAYIYDVPSSFTNAEVSNTPGANGTLDMSGGGDTRINTFHFSSAVINPYLDLFSIGQWSVPVRFNFLNATPEILSQGTGHWGGGLLQSNGVDSVIGYEGNGLLKFTGTFTDISFITPDYEYYYGATVGVADRATSVPESNSWGLLLIGLGAVALIARRRSLQV
jgi:hypothetical protein